MSFPRSDSGSGERGTESGQMLEEDSFESLCVLIACTGGVANLSEDTMGPETSPSIRLERKLRFRRLDGPL